MYKVLMLVHALLWLLWFQINAFERLYPEYIRTFDDRKEYLSLAMKADSMFRTFIQVLHDCVCFEADQV